MRRIILALAALLGGCVLLTESGTQLLTEAGERIAFEFPMLTAEDGGALLTEAGDYINARVEQLFLSTETGALLVTESNVAIEVDLP